MSELMKKSSQKRGLVSCYDLFELNRRMPNGMYGGVRGGVILPLLDYYLILIQVNKGSNYQLSFKAPLFY